VWIEFIKGAIVVELGVIVLVRKLELGVGLAWRGQFVRLSGRLKDGLGNVGGDKVFSMH
jgi:hypothetical protein